MSTRRRIILVFIALFLISLACEAAIGDTSEIVPTTVVIPTQAAASQPTSASLPTVLPGVSLGKIPYQAVVRISAIENGQESWWGSGSIISPDGLILTNAHVVLGDKYYPAGKLQIELTVKEDSPPQPAYYAEVMQAEPTLDIAIIRITTDLSGNPVDRAMLNLPAVPLGNSDDLHMGDPLTIIGYPLIGGNTVTLTRGEVSGFTSEQNYGDRAFIKTSATISGGNSGGLAADEKGVLVGIPTQLGYGGEDQFVDCRRLADTNRDGVIDENDSCVPGGGFINALRPINLAKPLIEAAQRGEVGIGQAPAEQANLPTSGNVLYEDDFSSPGSGWDDGGVDIGSTHYLNGAYQIEVIKQQSYVWGNPYQSFGDVAVGVNAQVFQSTGQGDFGILCHYQDVDNFYALEVSEDGFFAIWKRMKGETQNLVEWQSSSDIPQDGGVVTIEALCSGSELALAVNGVVLARVSDNSFNSGDVGLVAGTWEKGDLVVGFDNLKVYKP